MQKLIQSLSVILILMIACPGQVWAMPGQNPGSGAENSGASLLQDSLTRPLLESPSGAQVTDMVSLASLMEAGQLPRGLNVGFERMLDEENKTSACLKCDGETCWKVAKRFCKVAVPLAASFALDRWAMQKKNAMIADLNAEVMPWDPLPAGAGPVQKIEHQIDKEFYDGLIGEVRKSESFMIGPELMLAYDAINTMILGFHMGANHPYYMFFFCGLMTTALSFYVLLSGAPIVTVNTMFDSLHMAPVPINKEVGHRFFQKVRDEDIEVFKLVLARIGLAVASVWPYLNELGFTKHLKWEDDPKPMKFVPPHDPVLSRKAIEVPKADLRSSEVQNILQRLMEFAYSNQDNPEKPILVGLAAPQVGISRRVIMVDVGANGIGGVSDLRTYINPVVTWESEDITTWYEGCYSTSNVTGIVKRPRKIVIEALDTHGNWIREEHEGYVARIFLHEIDHLDGIEFVQHVTDDEDLHWVERHEFPQYRNQQAWRHWEKKCSRARWNKIKFGNKGD